jgi:hypothetical protein
MVVFCGCNALVLLLPAATDPGGAARSDASQIETRDSDIETQSMILNGDRI